jgi:hypothetical protein
LQLIVSGEAHHLIADHDTRSYRRQIILPDVQRHP